MRNRAIGILLGMLSLIITAVVVYPSLQFELGLSSLTAQDSDEYRHFEEYSRQFPSGQNTWLVAIDFQGKKLGRHEFLKVDVLCKQLEKLEGVHKVYNLSSIRIPQRSVFGLRNRQLLPLESDRAFENGWKRLEAYPDVRPKFISLDETATCVYLELDREPSEKLVHDLKQQVEHFDFPEVHYAGSSMLSVEAKKQLSKEMNFLGMIGAAILFVLLSVLFRDWRSILLSTLLVLFNASWVILLFWISERPVSVLALTTPLLIAVLSFSDIVHILFAVRNRSREIPLLERVRTSMREIRAPLWLTSLTTFLAFAVFLFSPVTEIVDFGWITCLGIALSYLSARFLLPELIVLIGVGKQTFFSFGWVHRILGHVLLRPRVVVRIGTFATIALLGLSISTLHIDNHALNNGSDRLMDGQIYMNEKFGGTRSVEVIVSGEKLLGVSTLHKVNQIEHYLLKEYGCTSVFSINTVAKRLNRFEHFGRSAFYALPETIDETFLAKLREYKDVLGLGDALSKDEKTLKIVGRLKDGGSADALARTEKLETFLASLDQGDTEVFVSGHAILNDRSMHLVTSLILLGVLISLVIATVLTGIYFRAWRLVLAVLLPNLLPLLAALVFLGIFQMDLNPFSAMALSILLGLSLDDTIYITGTYLQKRDQGVDLIESVGWNLFPVIATSLILAVGFGVLLFSSLEPNQNIGLLVSIILVIALLSDLLLLPAMLKWASKERN